MNMAQASQSMESAIAQSQPSMGARVEQAEQPASQTHDSSATGQEMTSAQHDQKTLEELIDLDSVDKFKFQGEEWTPDKLQKSFMLHKDYTKKTTELAKERQYIANLKADLAKVKRNPELADEFKRLYPEKFHDYLEIILEQAEAMTQETSHSPDDVPAAVAKQLADLQKRFETYDKKIKTLDEREHAAKVSEIQQQLDQLFTGLSKKYDLAVEEAVLAKAEALIANGYQMNDAAWDRLYKENHKANEARYNKRYADRTKQQLEANRQGADIGRGGATPSPGKRKMTLDDAREHMIASLTRGG
jgi:hypothetical protein